LWLPTLIKRSKDQIVKLFGIKTFLWGLSIQHHFLFVNAWINVFIYAITKQNFRKAFKLFLTNFPWNWRNALHFDREETYRIKTVTGFSKKINSKQIRTSQSIGKVACSSSELDFNAENGCKDIEDSKLNNEMKTSVDRSRTTDHSIRTIPSPQKLDVKEPML